jgi:hypothetical protein
MFVLITIYENIIPTANGQIFTNKTLFHSYYKTFINAVRFKALMMLTKEYVFWGVMPYSLVQVH